MPRKVGKTMTKYCLNLNTQSNGDHEIHKESCQYYYMFKNGNNFEYLGDLSSEYDALRRAKVYHPLWQIDGCAYCCPSIHNH